ncbi:MAG: phosphopentomutase [Mycoplasmatales bacterium]
MAWENKINKIILLVIDGFGVGEMDDVATTRPLDIGANTAKHVLENNPHLKFNNLRKLGLHQLLDLENMTEPYIIGKAKLAHYGADSYFGHQEINGSKPLKVEERSFSSYISEIIELLEDENINYQLVGKNLKLLLIENTFTIGDNIETDPGQAFNITADLNKMEFTQVVEIAEKIRSIIKVPRLIVFGSKETSIEQILAAIEEHEQAYIGVNAPKSGVYTDSYQCVHLGFGIDYTKQTAFRLDEAQVPVTLIGKAADVIVAPNAKFLPAVATDEVMEFVLKANKTQTNGLIFANVQETDLAGHAQDVHKFANKLQIVDDFLGNLIEQLDDNTLLIVMADHGDDPTIGHPQHTREYVPILCYLEQNNKQINLGILPTMADIGQTIIKLLMMEDLENGTTIHALINN